MEIIILIILLFLFLFFLIKPKKIKILEIYENVLLLTQIIYTEKEERQILDFSLVKNGIVGLQIWTKEKEAKEFNGIIEKYNGTTILRVKNKGDEIWVWQLPEEE